MATQSGMAKLRPCQGLGPDNLKLYSTEHGTGKMSLIYLAINSVNKPKGILYLDLPPKCNSEGDVAAAILEAVGWCADPLVDSSKRKYSSSLPISFLEANRFAATSVQEALEKKNFAPPTGTSLITSMFQSSFWTMQIANVPADLLQDYAKLAADQGTATIVFVSSEGRVPVMSKSCL